MLSTSSCNKMTILKTITINAKMNISLGFATYLRSEIQDEYGIKLIVYFCHIPLVFKKNKVTVGGPDLETMICF
jgi:hypothetical protein